MGSFFDREVQRLESTTDRLTKRANEKKDTESSKLETNKVGWVQSIKQAIYSHLYIGVQTRCLTNGEIDLCEMVGYLYVVVHAVV